MVKVFIFCAFLVYTTGANADSSIEDMSAIPVEEKMDFDFNDDFHHSMDDKPKQHKAYSFQQFYGPVDGKHHEIGWDEEHDHKSHDFKAHPKYKFVYGVDDHHTHDFHGQMEHRDGKKLHGEYHIREPGGNVRTVKYFADQNGGFFAQVHNQGGNNHEGYGR